MYDPILSHGAGVGGFSLGMFLVGFLAFTGFSEKEVRNRGS